MYFPYAYYLNQLIGILSVGVIKKGHKNPSRGQTTVFSFRSLKGRESGLARQLRIQKETNGVRSTHLTVKELEDRGTA